MRERLRSKPNDVVCKYLFKPAILEHSKRSFDNMIKVNLAHVLMLSKQKIISKQASKKLLCELLALKKKGPKTLKINPLLEDYYFNVEQYIISQVGLEIGGKMHTARSRNDLGATITRMNVRDYIIDILPRIIELRSILLNIALVYTNTVLTGYTHLQPAQPITLAHYFTAIAGAIERDYQRLEEAYKRLNYSPLGGVAFAGTSFNIDRYYTAKLLGFYGPIENSMDAVVSRDYLLEISSHFSTLGSTINRFANDLYIWATHEFDFIEVDDSMAASSSIMPQKKNPITLEHIKSKTSHLLSAYVSIFSCMKGIPYGHCKDLGDEAIYLFWEVSIQIESIFELLNATLKTIKINQNKMKLRTNQNFSTMTDLADELVKKEGLSFRVAHQIIGGIVGDCISKGLSADNITVKMLDKESRKYASRTLNWTQHSLDLMLNAEYSVKNKISLGSPAPKECQKMIQNLNFQLNNDKNTYNHKVEKLKESTDRLFKEATQEI